MAKRKHGRAQMDMFESRITILRNTLTNLRAKFNAPPIERDMKRTSALQSNGKLHS